MQITNKPNKLPSSDPPKNPKFHVLISYFMFVTMSNHPKISCTWVHNSVCFIVLCLNSYSKFHNFE